MLAASTPVWTLIGGIAGAISAVVGVPLIILNTDYAWARLRAARTKKGRQT